MNKPKRVILVRHAEPVKSGKEKLNSGLTQEGETEAQAAGEYLDLIGPVDNLFTSNLKRAKKTADIIESQINTPKTIIPELEEIDLGDWKGMEPKEVRSEYPGLVEDFKDNPEDFQVPNGERISNFIQRIRKGLKKVFGQVERNDTVVIVGHRIILSFINCWLRNIDFRRSTELMPNDYCSITMLERDSSDLEYNMEIFDQKPSLKILYSLI